MDILISHLRPKHRKGQGLVEFALALPILLLLLFGVIEFGRLLQTWLAIQNAARFGLRYLVTGEYDPSYCDEATAALSLSTADTFSGDPANDCFVPDEYGDDARDLTNALVDWSRLPSSRNTALAGASGVPIDESVSGDYITFLSSHQFFDLGNASLPRYFHATVCSSRDSDLVNGPDFWWDDTTAPETCYDSINDYLMDDAGGPGDRVRIMVTYNHATIVPFVSLLWPVVPLTTWREGIVERFRTSRISGIGSQISSSPSDTPTPTATSTGTPTPTTTVTPTPDCGLIYSRGAFWNGERFQISVQNDNFAPAYLTHSALVWPNTWNPTMYFHWFQFSTNRYWDPGSIYSSPVETAAPNVPLASRSNAYWVADFNDIPAIPAAGFFSGSLTFEYSGLSCPVYAELIVVPTATATNTPIPTDTPDWTATYTRTATNTRTPTSTATNTPTHTDTPIHTNTLPPTNTPTHTSTNTPTNTGTPPTPTFTPTVCLTPPDLGGCR